MFSRLDFIERVRSKYIPPLGRLVRRFNDCYGTNYYVESATTHDQYALSVNMDEEELEEVLEDMGFERNPLASFKNLAGTEEYEEGSWRRTYGKMQLHVLLYDGNPGMNNSTGEMHLYAHWEYRWDFHPLRHYRGHNYNAPEGVSRLQDIFSEHDVNYHMRKISPSDL